MPRHWAEAYVGIPYAEADCTELVRRVVFERFGFDLRLPGEREWRDMAPESAQAIIGELGSRVAHPVEGDVVLMRERGAHDTNGSHVGVFVAPGGARWVLHAVESMGTLLQPETVLPRLQFEVMAYYRWRRHLRR